MVSRVAVLVSASAFASATTLSSAALAQEADPDRLQVSGSFRVRYEAIDGQTRVGFNASDDLLNTRLRVLGVYDAGPVSFGAELFDSRVFLDDAGSPVSTNEVNTAELVQAYVAADFDGPNQAPVHLQAGRFMLNLGSRRLVAADDYRNTTNGSTGAIATIGRRDGANIALFYVLPQVRLPDDRAGLDDQDVEWDRESGDLALFGVLATAPDVIAGGALQATYVGLRESDRADSATRDRALDTFGLRAFRAQARGALDFDIEAFAQTGTISVSAAANALEQDVSAWFAHAELGRQFDRPWRPRVSVVADYASGDEPGGDYQRFDTLFGMRRAELAPSGLYNTVGRANLASAGARIDAQPNARTDMFAALRGLWLASDTDSFSTSGVRDPSGASGDFAGLQLDARLRYWIAPERVRLEANFVYLDKGSFLQDAPNANTTRDTAYVAFDLSFLF